LGRQPLIAHGCDATPLSLTDRVSRRRETLSAEIDDAAVALDVARGACYGLDGVAARIWALIETPVAIGDACATLAELYEVDDATCRKDVLDFLADLRAEGLIDVLPAAQPQEA